MAKKLPKETQEIISKYGLTQADVWDCHGTWVIYHKALERIAAQNKITFQEPRIICNDIANKMVAVWVSGFRWVSDDEHIGEWSIGEAAPYNSKNSYPFAMAEKRAKDRVILKLLGLHGDFYSEEEADNFKENKPTQKDLGPRNVDTKRFSGPKFPLRAANSLKKDDHAEWKKMLSDLRDNQNTTELAAWKREKEDEYANLPDTYSDKLLEAYEEHMKELETLEQGVAAE